ncbi:MAG: magnesium transporter [Chloroflexi bacterium]|nr:MAG: magnesium transporter [Chloroflexota bacterium]
MATYQYQYGRVTWTNIISPTQEDVAALREAYPFIHPLHLEDLLSRIERPKIDEDEDYLLIVLHFPWWDAEKNLSRASEVDIFIGRGFIVTVHDGILKPLLRIEQRCKEDEEERENLLGQGANHTMYVIIDQLVDYIFPILRKIDSQISEIEEDMFTRDTRSIIQEIAIVRRDVIALRRIIRAQVPVMENLETTESAIIHDELEEYFGDIVDHLHKARDIVDEDVEIIAGLADTADTLASHRINEVMRILTVISVTMLPLTLVSSIYGMNIKLPLGNHPNAIVIISGIMIFITASLLGYFRYRNWL